MPGRKINQSKRLERDRGCYLGWVDQGRSLWGANIWEEVWMKWESELSPFSREESSKQKLGESEGHEMEACMTCRRTERKNNELGEVARHRSWRARQPWMNEWIIGKWSSTSKVLRQESMMLSWDGLAIEKVHFFPLGNRLPSIRFMTLFNFTSTKWKEIIFFKN